MILLNFLRKAELYGAAQDRWNQYCSWKCGFRDAIKIIGRIKESKASQSR